jgi:glutaminyl-tRNA synthetase
MKKVTRFPPEPNGFLHLGHCKSIFINWLNENDCHLRLDDTNPQAEKDEFVENIIEDIKWLGFDPGNITYTSDYFDKLYEYAELLIKNNLAYVDFTPNDLMREQRHNGIENEYRNKPTEWNLEQFQKMKSGLYIKSECVLRLKIDMQNNNHVLRDPIAYRISLIPHHRTGNKWCIYPSYDYSHGIIDAIEGITHSYCTDEFYIRRDLYYWTPLKLKELGIKLEVAEEIEYGKLSVQNNILSKRNINKLIQDGMDYDDPRLLTIKGLKRRGFTPGLIKQIVDCTSMEKRETIISTKFIENLLRTEYNNKAIRIFGIIDPIKVDIIDFENIIPIELTHPNHPVIKELGSHKIKLTNKIYIEKEDFSPIYIKDFYRFMPGNMVRLRHCDNNFFEITESKLDADFIQTNLENNIVKIKKADITGINPKKIKGCIHWISNIDANEAIFELFTELAPEGKFNPDSKIIKRGYVQKYALEILDKPFQLERKGFFKFDRYVNENNQMIPVFIQIVGLFDNNKI